MTKEESQLLPPIVIFDLAIAYRLGFVWEPSRVNIVTLDKCE